MTRGKPETDETRRAARRVHLERLNALEAPTVSQQVLRRRLARIEAEDPAQDAERDLRRVLDIP